MNAVRDVNLCIRGGTEANGCNVLCKQSKLQCQTVFYFQICGSVLNAEGHIYILGIFASG